MTGFVERGLPGVKVKLGREDPREDEARVAAVRQLIGRVVATVGELRTGEPLRLRVAARIVKNTGKLCVSECFARASAGEQILLLSPIARC